MTTTPTPTPLEILERAHNLLAQVHELGNLPADKQTELLVGGTSPAKMQEARLNYAATLALVAIAEALSDLASRDEDRLLSNAFAAGIGAAMRGHEAQFHSVFGGVPVPVNPDEAGVAIPTKEQAGYGENLPRGPK